MRDNQQTNIVAATWNVRTLVESAGGDKRISRSRPQHIGDETTNNSERTSQHLVDCKLDLLVIWSTSAIHLVELTVPLETNITDAAERKVHRYRDLADACACSHHTTIITLEVDSEGFLSTEGFKHLYKLLRAKATDRQNFELDIIRHVVVSCFKPLVLL